MKAVEPRRLTDIWIWTLAASLAVVSLWLPGYLRVASDRESSLIVTGAALFFSGVLMGSLRPVRIWRWPLASIIAFAVWDIAKAAARPDFYDSSEPAAIIGVLAANTPQNWLWALPVLIGAIAGAGLMHRSID